MKIKKLPFMSFGFYIKDYYFPKYKLKPQYYFDNLIGERGPSIALRIKLKL